VRSTFNSAQDMLDDADFKCVMRNWVRTCKLDNMNVERLFALLRKSVGGEQDSAPPLAEKICSTGFLAQWKSKHKEFFGADMGIVTRRELLSKGWECL
jgi:hypothetical protein